MTNRKVGGRRNFGFGRSLKYAVRRAMHERYGNGRFSTRYTQITRLYNFIRFLQQRGINDLRRINESVVHGYVESLRQRVEQGTICISTATNYLSAVNSLMLVLLGDGRLKVSPRREIGSRTYVRRDVPIGINSELVFAAASYMESIGEVRVSAVLLLARTLGVRFREASLLCVRQALREAKRTGTVTVSKGSKGGRKRTVTAAPDALEVLIRFADALGPGDNVIPEHVSYIQWQRYCYRVWRKYATGLGLSTKFHSLRASFACASYDQITGVPAPVVTGGRQVARLTDKDARLVIAKQLGHSRRQIVAAYVGTSLRKPQ